MDRPAERIRKLSIVRNRALAPMYSLPIRPKFIFFINDIYFCWRDLLELLYQGIENDAHIVSGVDLIWENATQEFAHYDTWVSRDIDGMPFLVPWHIQNLKSQGNDTLFPSLPPPSPGMLKGNFSIHNETREKFWNLIPFQVSCTWGGGALLSAKPFFPPYNVNFCASALVPQKPKINFEEESEIEKLYNQMPQYSSCDASECSNLCKDFGILGFHRMMIVPRVVTTYNVEQFNKSKSEFLVSRPFTKSESGKIEWKESYPKATLCMPWKRQYLKLERVLNVTRFPFGWEIIVNQTCVRQEGKTP